MKKLDLGQTISILANIGVIAGIVFLAEPTEKFYIEVASREV